MDLEARLRAFAAVVRRGSFSAAAEEIAVSQPAVSKHVAALERELGVLLVTRGRRLSLTPEGAYLGQMVLRAESLLAQATRGVAAMTTSSAGRVVVAASGIPGTYLIPAAVAVIAGSHPALIVEIVLGTSAEAVDAVRRHRAEIGIVGGLVAAPELDIEPLIEDELVVVGAPGMSAGPWTARQLASRTWLTREEGSATRAALEATWRDLGISPARVVELPSWEAVKLTAAAGVGVAAISRLAVDVETRAGTLAVLEVARWRVRRTISLVRADDVPLTPAANAVAAALQAVAMSRSEVARPVRPPSPAAGGRETREGPAS